MEKKGESSDISLKDNKENLIFDKIKDDNIKEENENISSEYKMINNINDYNISNIKMEKNKILFSNATYEPKNTLKEPYSKTPDIKTFINKNKKNDYIYRNKYYSHKISHDNYMTNYTLDVSLIKKFLSFQNKYMKNEKDIIDTNKCLHAYSIMHPKDKINPIYFYILKNYQKDYKQNINTNENNEEEKYTPKKI